MHKLMAGASLLPFLLFSTAASAAVSVNANDEMSTVRTTVPVQHGWMFSSDEDAVLDAQVECPDGVRTDFEAVLIRDLSLMSGKNDTVARLCSSISRDTTLTLNFGKLQPGFYEVDITGAEPFNIGCDPEKIVSPKTAKPDFDQFWAANLAELKSVPLEYEMELIPERSTAARNVYRVTINTTDGAVMGGIYAEPVNQGKYPAYIEYMGYGADACKELWRYMHDLFTNEYKLNNLIWVWTVQSSDAGSLASVDKMVEWYPGDEYCDIVGADLYVTKNTTQSAVFERINNSVKGKKMVVLSEFGNLLDIDGYFEEDAPWGYFMNWCNTENSVPVLYCKNSDGSYSWNNTADDWKNAMGNSHTLNRDDIPSLK